jgi:arylsulfatase
LLAAAGDATIKDRLLKGASIGGKTFKVHLDGYNQLPYLTGQTQESARREFYYYDDDAELVATRVDNWKYVWCEQRAPGGFQVWSEPLVCLRVPKVFNLRMDPYERADVVSDQYYDWVNQNGYIMAFGIMKASAFLQTFLEYPPSQPPASFTVTGIAREIDEKIKERAKAGKK